MLRIFYGDYQDKLYISNPDIFFDNTYREEWLEDQVSKDMIRDVDGSEVVGVHLINSPYLGPIPPEKLSGGVKTLILMNNDNLHVFNASACGDNCAKWMLQISEEKDILVRLGYLMDFGDNKFEIEVVNTGKIVHNIAELNDEVIKYRLI